MIGTRIADKITKVTKTSPRNDSETVTSEYEKRITYEKNMYIQKKHRKLFMVEILRINNLNLGQKIWLKQRMTLMEHMTPVI